MRRMPRYHRPRLRRLLKPAMTTRAQNERHTRLVPKLQLGHAPGLSKLLLRGAAGEAELRGRAHAQAGAWARGEEIGQPSEVQEVVFAG